MEIPRFGRVPQPISPQASSLKSSARSRPTLLAQPDDKFTPKSAPNVFFSAPKKAPVFKNALDQQIFETEQALKKVSGLLTGTIELEESKRIQVEIEQPLLKKYNELIAEREKKEQALQVWEMFERPKTPVS